MVRRRYTAALAIGSLVVGMLLPGAGSAAPGDPGQAIELDRGPSIRNHRVASNGQTVGYLVEDQLRVKAAADSADAPSVIANDVSGFTFTPDSETVVYLADVDGVGRLFRRAVDGSSPVEPLTDTLPATASIDQWELTPDGTRVIFIADTDVDELFEVRIVELATGEISSTGAPLAGNRDAAVFDIADDGSRVVYEVGPLDPEVLSAPLPPTGSGVFRLSPTAAGQPVSLLGVSPGGEWTVTLVSPTATKAGGLFVSPTDGAAAPVPIVVLGAGDNESESAIRSTFDFAPIGELAAFSLAEGTGWYANTVRLDTAVTTLLIPSAPAPTTRQRATISPDGATAVVATTGPGTQLVAVPVDGGDATILAPGLDITNPATAAFTPDTTSVVVTGEEDGVAAVWSVPLNGAPALRLVTSEASAFSVTLSADGSRALLRSQVLNRTPGPAGLLSVPVLGGTAVRLSRDVGSSRGPTDERVRLLGNGRAVFTATTSSGEGLYVSEVGFRCQGRLADWVGTAADDVLDGTSRDEVFFARGGADVIRGRGGNDVVCAGGGDDTVIGGGDDDTLLGQRGRDALRGNAGDDTCNGGRGRDTAPRCETRNSIP